MSAELHCITGFFFYRSASRTMLKTTGECTLKMWLPWFKPLLHEYCPICPFEEVNSLGLDMEQSWSSERSSFYSIIVSLA